MKKVITMSSVLLGVVFLAGCGQQPVSQTQPTTPASVTKQPVPPIDETSAWQTYTNEVLGLEFKYPNGWFVREEKTENNKRIYIESSKGGENYDLSNYPKDFAMLYLEYWGPVYDKAMSYAQITQEMSSVPKVTINTNSTPIDIYETNTISDEGPQGVRVRAYWQHNGMTYSADTADMGLKQNQIEGEALKKILSTFKFTK